MQEVPLQCMGEVAAAGTSALTCLHSLILRCLSVHRISTTVTNVRVADEAQAKWAASVLVASELSDGCLSILSGIELHNTSATGASIWFILDFRLLDRANGCEEIDEIFVAGRPR
jgi:hypothetical protein